ncbi:YciI family protein [Nocardioides rubriscoriae]|uniref:YciI family protein n=1 Tax=Nocardioides rubriscoriae TaxID=642762 RepID=UPI0014790015|nr:YciI family protein [Nocardioides rubriscoriae]
MPAYVVLFPADDEVEWQAADQATQQVTYDTDAEFARLLAAAGGRITGGAGLAPSSATRTLRRGSGPDPVVTDGPHAAGPAQLAGFFLVTCDDLDTLVEAARVLTRVHPVVEVRPVDED